MYNEKYSLFKHLDTNSKIRPRYSRPIGVYFYQFMNCRQNMLFQLNDVMSFNNLDR